MYRNRKNPALITNESNVSSVLSTEGSPVLSQLVNGISQPPRKSVAIMPLVVSMFAYSAMKNIENFIELYSV